MKVARPPGRTKQRGAERRRRYLRAVKPSKVPGGRLANLRGSPTVTGNLTEYLAPRLARKEEIAGQVIELWTEFVRKGKDLTPKPNDAIRASELLGKYAGILEKEGDTYNTVVLGDLKGASEADLLARLDQLKQAKQALSTENDPIDV